MVASPEKMAEVCIQCFFLWSISQVWVCMGVFFSRFLTMSP